MSHTDAQHHACQGGRLTQTGIKLASSICYWKFSKDQAIFIKLWPPLIGTKMPQSGHTNDTHLKLKTPKIVAPAGLKVFLFYSFFLLLNHWDFFANTQICTDKWLMFWMQIACENAVKKRHRCRNFFKKIWNLQENTNDKRLLNVFNSLPSYTILLSTGPELHQKCFLRPSNRAIIEERSRRRFNWPPLDSETMATRETAASSQYCKFLPMHFQAIIIWCTTWVPKQGKDFINQFWGMQLMMMFFILKSLAYLWTLAYRYILKKLRWLCHTMCIFPITHKLASCNVT